MCEGSGFAEPRSGGAVLVGFVVFRAKAQSAEGLGWFVSWRSASCFCCFDFFWEKGSFQAAGGSLRALRSFASSAREKKGAKPLLESLRIMPLREALGEGAGARR